MKTLLGINGDHQLGTLYSSKTQRKLSARYVATVFVTELQLSRRKKSLILSRHNCRQYAKQMHIY